MMSRFLKVLAVILLGLVVTTTATFAAVPVLRHVAISWLQGPTAIPAASGDARVRYEGDAEDFAAAVARLLPDAIATVEAAHGRPFAQQPIVTVYADQDAFMRGNFASGSPVGTTAAGRISLAPALWTERREQLCDILVHELSHAHLQSHLSAYTFGRIPSWFHEGLAVMVSQGGGAANVSEAVAREALRKGHAITVRDATGLFGFPFDPPQDRNLFPLNPIGQHMIYRQAGMFVAYLRARDPPAFRKLLDALLEGTQFRAAFESSYGTSLSEVWRGFAEL